jgi:hypothetical protein
MTVDRSARDAPDDVVVAYTTGDDAHPAVRLSAVQHARDHGCSVILYDADAASAIAEPMPNQWGSEGEGRNLGDRLDPDDLEFLGREPLATQVREARAGGAQAYGWLPKDHGPGALAEYAIEQQAHLVFVPDELETIDELSSALAGAPDATEVLKAPGIRVERVAARVPGR